MPGSLVSTRSSRRPADADPSATLTCPARSEEHTSELQSHSDLVCRLLLEKKNQIKEMTRKVSAEVDLVHQQTQNQRYGSSHIGKIQNSHLGLSKHFDSKRWSTGMTSSVS